MINNIPTLFDIQPTITRRNTSYHSRQPSECKTQHQRILYILSKHPLLRYDQIPGWYLIFFDAKIKESSVVARLNELVKLGYVSSEKEKLNCECKLMVTAYELTGKGVLGVERYSG